ncbi:hypothetical protein U9M48_037284 [Paspalum notatum var. saurae]|uniref:Uncharacterized protein n=1 Tax=Paspalum notatum var. saurae TaxID=547442 RepID=A0AAQ3UEN2_PASNO
MAEATHGCGAGGEGRCVAAEVLRVGVGGGRARWPVEGRRGQLSGAPRAEGGDGDDPRGFMAKRARGPTRPALDGPDSVKKNFDHHRCAWSQVVDYLLQPKRFRCLEGRCGASIGVACQDASLVGTHASGGQSRISSRRRAWSEERSQAPVS